MKNLILYFSLYMVSFSAIAENKIAILQLYKSEKTNFNKMINVLDTSGFQSTLLAKDVDSLHLKNTLDSVQQLWIISDKSNHLDSVKLKIIEHFYRSGKGVFVLADNEPYNLDANMVLNQLENINISGNFICDKVLQKKSETDTISTIRPHEVTKDLNYFYEGFTVASIEKSEKKIEPIIFGSEGNLIVASYSEDGKRLLIDGGFTRMYNKWNSSTATYIINVANWLK